MKKRTRSIVSSLIVSVLAGSSLWAQTQDRPEGHGDNLWQKGASVVGETRHKGSSRRNKKTAVTVKVAQTQTSLTAAEGVAQRLAGVIGRQRKATELIDELLRLETNRDLARSAKEAKYREAQRVSNENQATFSFSAASCALSVALLYPTTDPSYPARAIVGMVIGVTGLTFLVVGTYIGGSVLDEHLKEAAKLDKEEQALNRALREKADELRRLQIKISTAK